MVRIAGTYGVEILAAFGVTLVCSLTAITVAMAIGLPLALGLRSQSVLMRGCCRCYVEAMRGSPLLLLLFLVYYGGPSLGVTLDAVSVGVIGLGLYGAGFYAEIFRAGLIAVPKGQTEVARLMGFPASHIVFQIQIPQMLPIILPPSVGQAIVILKELSVLSIITVGELTKMTTQISNETFTVTAPFLIAAMLYWVGAKALSAAGIVVTRHLTSPGLRP